MTNENPKIIYQDEKKIIHIKYDDGSEQFDEEFTVKNTGNLPIYIQFQREFKNPDGSINKEKSYNFHETLCCSTDSDSEDNISDSEDDISDVSI